MSRIQWIVAGLFLVCLLLLVKSLLRSPHDLKAIARLDDQIQQQEKINESWQVKNTKLVHSIYLLKNDPDYVEGIARRNFGLIQKGEVFYQYTIQDSNQSLS